jgi:hypothetical protein
MPVGPEHKAERAFRSVLMPGRPARRAAQPNLNVSDSTQIPTEYKGSKRPRSGTLRLCWR